MPIKCTLGDIDRLRSQPERPGIPKVTGVLEKLWNTQFPPNAVADAFRAGRFCRVMLEEVKDYEAQLLKLAREYGEPAENGNIKVSPERVSAYLKAKSELDAVEHEVQTILLKLSVLAHLTSLTPPEVLALEKFTEDVLPE